MHVGDSGKDNEFSRGLEVEEEVRHMDFVYLDNLLLWTNLRLTLLSLFLLLCLLVASLHF